VGGRGQEVIRMVRVGDREIERKGGEGKEATRRDWIGYPC
jgi:hypothetical protein